MVTHPLNILFITGPFPAPTESFILNQITGLLDRGHRVTILTLEAQREQFAFLPEQIKKYKLEYFIKTLEPIYETYWLWAVLKDVIKYPAEVLRMGKFLFHSRGKNRKEAYRYLKTFLGQSDFDCLHVQFGIYAKHALMLRELGISKAAIVSAFRGYDMRKDVLIKKQVEFHQLLKHASALLPVSHFFKQKLIDYGAVPSKVHVIRSGVNSDDFSFSCLPEYQTTEAFRIISIGRLVPKKGHLYLLKAVKILVQKGHLIQLTIVGEGYEKTELESFCEQEGIKDFVQFQNFCTHAEISEKIRKHHVLVHPSVTASDGDAEGVPNVIKEAMLVGRPVIATQHAGIPELIQHGKTGYLCAEKSSEEIAFWLQELMQMYATEQLSHMLEHARSHVLEEYDHRKIAQELEQLYHEIIENER